MSHLCVNKGGKKREKSTQNDMAKNKNALQINDLQGYYRAQNRNRTCTSLRTPDFESDASTNSAIWACGLQI